MPSTSDSPSSHSGWRRRVSLKRLTQRLVVGLEEEQAERMPASLEPVELGGSSSKNSSAAHVADDREAADAAAGQLGELHELAR